MNKQVLYTVIDSIAERQPSRFAIESGESKITYLQLKQFTDHIARCLVTLKLEKGSVIGVYLPSSCEYILSIIGVNKAGCIFMPVETVFPSKRLSYVLQAAQPGYIITDKNHSASLREILGEMAGEYKLIEIVIDENKLGLELNDEIIIPSENALPVVEGNDSNYLIYTSGSTGNPKIIEGRHKSLSHFIHWETGEFQLASETRCCQFAPVSFDVSFRDIFTPLLAGGCIIIPTKEDRSYPRRFLEWVYEKKITLLHIVPSFFREMVREINEENKYLAGSLKYIMLAGEPLYGKDVINWKVRMGDGAELVNLYGPSETTLAKVYNRIRESPANAHEVMPLGKPINNTSVVIIHHDRLCNIGEIGEIYIKTPFVSKGYYNDTELTLQKFIQNPLHNEYEDILYRTGDLGKYLPDKSIAFAGRTDSQVKIRGNRVELFEVIQTIQGFKGIKHAEVITWEQKDGELQLACYYTEQSLVKLTALKEYLGNYLPEYMHPSYFVKLQDFPLNINGKIDKKALPKPEEMFYEQFAYEAPGNELETTIAGTWKEVLGLKKVGVNNSFFQLGGHSLSATRIVSSLFQQLNVTISLKDFFENNTVRKLASFIQQVKMQKADPIGPAAVKALYEASFSQKRIHLLSSKSPLSTAYHMPAAFQMSNIDVPALKKAFRLLVERHEILRTNFIDKGGVLFQSIQEAGDFQVKEYNMELQVYDDDIAQDCINTEIKSGFDLETGPLLKVSLFRFAKQQYVLVFIVHHIASDGWSMNVITHDIAQLYKALRENEPLELSPLGIQFKDYSEWQHLQVAKNKEDELFWHHHIGNDWTPLTLPLDYARPAIRSDEGSTISTHFPAVQVQEIRNFCATSDISLFVFFQAIIHLLLHKVSGQTSILLGAPVSGRDQPGLQNQVGPYLNYIVMRGDIDNNESFSNLLAKTRKRTYDYFKHSAYPFDKLVEELTGNSTSEDRNPLYDVLFVMNNAGLNASKKDMQELEELLQLKWIPVNDNSSKVDLTFFVNDDEKSISINTEYRTDLFSQHTIQCLSRDIIHLAYEAIKNPQLTPGEIIWNISGEQEMNWLGENKQLISEDF